MKRPSAWLLCVIGLLLLIYLLGCAMKWSHEYSVDVFDKYHTQHETNAVPDKP